MSASLPVKVGDRVLVFQWTPPNPTQQQIQQWLINPWVLPPNETWNKVPHWNGWQMTIIKLTPALAIVTHPEFPMPLRSEGVAVPLTHCELCQSHNAPVVMPLVEHKRSIALNRVKELTGV